MECQVKQKTRSGERGCIIFPIGVSLNRDDHLHDSNEVQELLMSYLCYLNLTSIFIFLWKIELARCFNLPCEVR
jgi:hypothetical protein